MSKYYILDGKTPVKEPSVIKWAVWFETADRIVRKDDLSKCEVSTIFLGLDHQWFDGPPLLFETMIFGGDHDGKQWRYSTWEEAEIGHQEAMRLVDSAG